jgi:hypothetical protein
VIGDLSREGALREHAVVASGVTGIDDGAHVLRIESGR